ncbi:uncharacterized protein CIMG_12903 [Coccidioides immitis RS]|uniref:Secreted protein n=1 Tax=Coccidioides immitis (strain RS) TaxID=246410 RepID=J3KGB4_COCIM|nr:uncharacterized protein CIMG_12903 [Coccidioides immitis RS]EAS34760.3 hypothetical protein CIMG_12903 [Coccidioides immitis RS]
MRLKTHMWPTKLNLLSLLLGLELHWNSTIPGNDKAAKPEATSRHWPEGLDWYEDGKSKRRLSMTFVRLCLRDGFSRCCKSQPRHQSFWPLIAAKSCHPTFLLVPTPANHPGEGSECTSSLTTPMAGDKAKDTWEITLRGRRSVRPFLADCETYCPILVGSNVSGSRAASAKQRASKKSG